MTGSREPRAGALAAGIILMLGLWQIIGASHVLGRGWPSLAEVVTFLAAPARHGLFLRATAATLRSAGLGYLIGAAIGTVFAVIGNLAPALRKGAERTNVWIHAIPVVALGPIFALLLSADAAPTAMAALSVMFAFYVAVTSSFAQVARSHTDVLTVLGAHRIARLVNLTIPAALPVIATGMKLAVPRASIGAILGEWFGAPRGLGVLMVTAMEEAHILLLWSAVLIVTMLSLAFFGLGALLERSVEARFR